MSQSRFGPFYQREVYPLVVTNVLDVNVETLMWKIFSLKGMQPYRRDVICLSSVISQCNEVTIGFCSSEGQLRLVKCAKTLKKMGYRLKLPNNINLNLLNYANKSEMKVGSWQYKVNNKIWWSFDFETCIFLELSLLHFKPFVVIPCLQKESSQCVDPKLHGYKYYLIVLQENYMYQESLEFLDNPSRRRKMACDASFSRHAHIPCTNERRKPRKPNPCARICDDKLLVRRVNGFKGVVQSKDSLHSGVIKNSFLNRKHPFSMSRQCKCPTCLIDEESEMDPIGGTLNRSLSPKSQSSEDSNSSEDSSKSDEFPIPMGLTNTTCCDCSEGMEPMLWANDKVKFDLVYNHSKFLQLVTSHCKSVGNQVTYNYELYEKHLEESCYAVNVVSNHKKSRLKRKSIVMFVPNALSLFGSNHTLTVIQEDRAEFDEISVDTPASSSSDVSCDSTFALAQAEDHSHVLYEANKENEKCSNSNLKTNSRMETESEISKTMLAWRSLRSQRQHKVSEYFKTKMFKTNRRQVSPHPESDKENMSTCN